MSHYRVKTTFNTEGAYGSTETHTLFAHHNLSCDIVSFYSENGEFIFAVEDTIDNNLLDAINRLYAPFEKNNVLSNGIESMSLEEQDKCGF